MNRSLIGGAIESVDIGLQAHPSLGEGDITFIGTGTENGMQR
jgi:hypothetical protein